MNFINLLAKYPFTNPTFLFITLTAKTFIVLVSYSLLIGTYIIKHVYRPVHFHVNFILYLLLFSPLFNLYVLITIDIEKPHY